MVKCIRIIFTIIKNDNSRGTCPFIHQILEHHSYDKSLPLKLFDKRPFNIKVQYKFYFTYICVENALFTYFYLIKRTPPFSIIVDIFLI